MGIGASSFEGYSVDQGTRAIQEHLHARNMTAQDAFSFLDKDHNGWISWEEFLAAVNQCLAAVYSPPAHSDSLLAVFRHFDGDSNGFLSLEEFSQAIGRSALLEKQALEVLERIAIALVRTGYSPQQLFDRLDKDRNGILSRLELEEVILGLQPDMTPSEREAVYTKLDKDGSGFLDLNEFHTALQVANAGPLVALEAKVKQMQRVFSASGYGEYESFNAFDANRDGFLSREEWQTAMASLVPDMNAVDIDAVFQRFDQNGDGFLSVQEFSQFFQDLSDRAAPLEQGVWPTYTPPPQEAPWEKEILDLVRDCLSIGRTGVSVSEVFRRLDVDHDGKMTAHEFDRMVTAYRPQLATEHLSSLFQKVNTSGSGSISLSEFVSRLG